MLFTALKYNHRVNPPVRFYNSLISCFITFALHSKKSINQWWHMLPQGCHVVLLLTQSLYAWPGDHQTRTTRPPFPLSTRVSHCEVTCDSSVARGAHSLPLLGPAWGEQEEIARNRHVKRVRGDKKPSLAQEEARWSKQQQCLFGIGSKMGCEGKILAESRGRSHFPAERALLILIHP